MSPEIAENHNFDVEFSLIGHVLCDSTIMARLGTINPGDFYSAQHAAVWEAMETLFTRGESLSPFNISPLIEESSLFDLAGGVIKYLAGSISHSLLYPWPGDQEKYLIRLAQNRRLSEACLTINSGEFAAKDAARFINNASMEILNASPTDEFSDNYQVTENILKNIKDNRLPDKTGLSRLDGDPLGGGLYPGKTYGFAARKKMGKTTFAGTISHNLNLSGVKHLFICGEMSPEEIQQRTLARATDSFASAFRSAYGESRAFQNKIAEYASTMPRNVIFKSSPGLTFDELKRVYIAAIQKHNIRGVILDYWQLVGGKQKNQSTSEHLDEVSQWIANFSRERGIWSVVMAQINQDGNTRGSEGIRLAFDQVYQINSPGDDPSGSARWLQMMETRYTAWNDVGTKDKPAYLLNDKGPYFEEINV